MDIKEVIEIALTGHPVVLRNGVKALVRHTETEYPVRLPVMGYMIHSDGILQSIYWTNDGRIVPNEYNDKDIVGLWLDDYVFNHWHLLKPTIKFIAKNNLGEWFGYTSCPKLNPNGRWARCSGSDFEYPLGCLDVEFPDAIYQCSLIERPEKRLLNESFNNMLIQKLHK